MSTRWIPAAARSLLGLTFTVFGLNGFLHFLPQPAPSGAAGAFAGALFATGYFLPLLKGTEVIAGLLLLSNRFVPLALTLLAPIIVNIAAFHLFLAPGPLMVAFLVGTEAYLAWAYRDAFAPMLKSHATPRARLDLEPGTPREAAAR
jgi:hypothetical protein